MFFVKNFLDEKMTDNLLSETIDINQPSNPSAAVIQDQQMPQQLPQQMNNDEQQMPQQIPQQMEFINPQPFQQQQSLKTDYIDVVKNWIMNYKYQIITAILILIGLIILVNVLKKKENFSFEAQNGILEQKFNVVPGKGAVIKTTFGENVYTQEEQLNGIDMSSVIQSDINMTAIKSSNQAEANLQREAYMGMKQPDEPDTDNNLQETAMMSLIKNQTHDIQIQQNKNISNSAIMNSLDLIKQRNTQRRAPMQDVNELEQVNKTAQTERDHQAMVQSAFKASMQLAPPDPNEIIKNRQKYTQNSNRPTQGVYDQLIEPISQSIEFKDKIDYKKEADIKTSGSDVQLPDMKPVQDQMNTTSITQEPVVQTDKEKVILDQQLVQTADKQNVVVEKTVNPEIIAKVEEQYSKWPTTIVSKQQREAAGQFMTILVLMKHSGLQIPKFDVLVQKFPELKNMKPSGVFKGFDKDIIRWANEQIDSVNKGEKTLDSIIAKFKVIYNIAPVQTALVGIQNQNGSITKQVDTVIPPTSTNKEGYREYATTINGKKKVVVKRQKYDVRNGNVSNKKTEKYQIII